MTESTTNKRRPTHTIYTINGDGPDASWIQIGLAFPHKDGNGLALVFNATPAEGRMALRAIPVVEAKPVPKQQSRLPLRMPIHPPDPLRRTA